MPTRRQSEGELEDSQCVCVCVRQQMHCPDYEMRHRWMVKMIYFSSFSQTLTWLICWCGAPVDLLVFSFQTLACSKFVDILFGCLRFNKSLVLLMCLHCGV